MLINSNFGNVKETYLFVEIARRVNDYKAANPSADIIRLGIGDVTQPSSGGDPCPSRGR